jgi:uncharacterized protein
MNKAKLAAVDAIYASLPKLVCRQLCAKSCGPIGMSQLEGKRIEKKVHRLPLAEGLTCNMLEMGRCAVYELRPLLCRLFGVVETMRCPHGCKPDRWLTHEQGHELLRQVHRLSPPLVERGRRSADGRTDAE